MAVLAPYMADYPWQVERFALRSSHHAPPPSYSPGDNRGAPPCLWGTLRFGDAVDDEWFATWLLRELTRRIPGTTGEAAGLPNLQAAWPLQEGHLLSPQTRRAACRSSLAPARGIHLLSEAP